MYNKSNIYVSIINLIYFVYVLFRYNTFLTSEKIITTIKYDHLHWEWTKYFNILFYMIMLIINLFVFIDIRYASLIFFFIFGTFFVSVYYFKQHIGEFWCFLVAYTPILILACTYLI